LRPRCCAGGLGMPMIESDTAVRARDLVARFIAETAEAVRALHWWERLDLADSPAGRDIAAGDDALRVEVMLAALTDMPAPVRPDGVFPQRTSVPEVMIRYSLLQTLWQLPTCVPPDALCRLLVLLGDAMERSRADWEGWTALVERHIDEFGLSPEVRAALAE